MTSVHSVQSLYLSVSLEVQKGSRLEAQQMRKLFESIWATVFPKLPGNVKVGASLDGALLFLRTVIRTEGHPEEKVPLACGAFGSHVLCPGV